MISEKLKIIGLLMIGGALGGALAGCSGISSRLDNDYDPDKYYIYVNPEMGEFSDVSQYDQMTHIYLMNLEIPDDFENEEEKLHLSEIYNRSFIDNNQEYSLEIEKATQWENIHLYDPEGNVLIDFDTGTIVEEVVSIGITSSNYETATTSQNVTFTEETELVKLHLILNKAIVEYNYEPVLYNFNLIVLIDFK